MATRKGKFLTGILGPVVLRSVRDKQVVSSKVAKGKIKHSVETKKSNQTFGMASTLATCIRQTIGDQLIGMTDVDMCSRLTGAVFSVLSRTRNKVTRQYHFEENSFESLNGFNFHPSFRVTNRILKLPELSWDHNTLTVSFPQSHQPDFLQFPYNSFKCTLTISLSLFRLQDGLMVAQAEKTKIVILKAVGLEAPLSFNFVAPQGCLYVACIYLQYVSTANNGFKAANSPRLTAACILKAALVPGEYQEKDQFNWVEMPPFETPP